MTNNLLASVVLVSAALVLVLGCDTPSGSDEISSTRISFTVTGTHFRPGFVLGEPAEFTLNYGDGSEPLTGTLPLGEFLPEDRIFQNPAAEHTVILTVTPPTALTVLNLGFLGGDGGNSDGVRTKGDLPLLPFHPAERPDPFIDEETSILEYTGTVTAVTGLATASELLAFCCEWQPITELDLSRCANLLTLEGYFSDIESISLQGCTSLRRCCLEATGANSSWRMEGGHRITNEWMDLSDCPDLRDIRGSADDHTMVWLHPSALNTLWHFCKWGNYRMTAIKIGNEPPGKMNISRFTALEELWISDSPILEVLNFDNGTTNSIWGSGTGITSVDIHQQTQVSYINLSGCDITSINIDGCTGLGRLQADGCGLSSTQVDYILTTLDEFNRTVEGEYYRITLADNAGSNRNEPPSETGLIHAQDLRDRGWTVTVNSTP